MEACRLTAKNIACRRGERLLFRTLSLDLVAGQAVQISGPNGTGKSSLIRILAGLLRPFAGAVTTEGMIGLLDERPALDEHQPLGRALGFWGAVDANHAAPPPGLGLDDLLDVPVRYLSTGQRKRAALARLTGQNAPIWLLDEPLNGLDVAAVAVVEAMVAQHLASGGIAVIASHQSFTPPGLAQIALKDFAA